MKEGWLKVTADWGRKKEKKIERKSERKIDRNEKLGKIAKEIKMV